MKVTWPVLTRYDQNHLLRIALPLGGIGTGTVSLGGRGDLRDWEIIDRPAKRYAPENCFFALWARPANGKAVTRAIEGAIDPCNYEGDSGCSVPNGGLPRFAQCSFAAAYPFGQVMLSDPDVPLDVRIEAFNPLIPCNADDSGIPVAVLRFVLKNKTDQTVFASVCGSLRNFICANETDESSEDKANEFRTSRGRGGIQGLFMRSKGVRPEARQFGSMALATTAQTRVTYRTSWLARHWNRSLVEFWDDFSSDGQLNEVPTGMSQGSLAVRTQIPAGGEKSITFIMTWHFPNRYTWTPKKSGKEHDATCPDDDIEDRIGNFYTTQYHDAWDVAECTAKRLAKLESGTLAFVRSFCKSDLPEVVKEAALYNLSTLRTQTVFRTPDGMMFGWEGCADQVGYCYGSCTHVWNYEQTTPFLFGGLSQGLRIVEFTHATDEEGRMSFRVNLPLDRACEHGVAAADGQMGCIMKMYRDWQLSGNDELLQRLWPKVKKTLEFCWIPGGWDADRDGIMEGCQHNTMDVEYFGPNPQMGLWYLGALRAAEEMARYLGDNEFANVCRGIFQHGSAWIDANLFNGEYYEHQIHASVCAENIAKGLQIGMGARDLAHPDFQLGKGCLVDQLVGQFMAHICGLGYLVNPNHIRTTLRSIRKYNFKHNMRNHFCSSRSFALGDEAALVMTAYPRGDRPKMPFPCFGEVMTGFEYTAAIGMLQEGLPELGLQCIRAVRDRFDGYKRSPFDEAECGHHYARAMIAWAAVLTLTGFRYSGVNKSIEFATKSKTSQTFWSNGTAWGTLRQQPIRRGAKVELTVLHGKLIYRTFTLAGLGTVNFTRPRTISAGKTETFEVPKQNNT
jgi:uncharacterized protein (DUF608 family)